MTAQTDRCSPQFAAERTRLLLGCYRKGEAEDPRTYVSAVATVLMHYPEAVVRSVTDPLFGIPGKIAWLPNIAEVRSACDAEMAPLLQAEARERRELELRGYLAGPPAESDEKRAAVVARWQDMRLEMAPPVEPPAEPKPSIDEGLAAIVLSVGPLPRLSDEALARVRRRDA